MGHAQINIIIPFLFKNYKLPTNLNIPYISVFPNYCYAFVQKIEIETIVLVYQTLSGLDKNLMAHEYKQRTNHLEEILFSG